MLLGFCYMFSSLLLILILLLSFNIIYYTCFTITIVLFFIFKIVSYTYYNIEKRIISFITLYKFNFLISYFIFFIFLLFHTVCNILFFIYLLQTYLFLCPLIIIFFFLDGQFMKSWYLLLDWIRLCLIFYILGILSFFFLFNLLILVRFIKFVLSNKYDDFYKNAPLVFLLLSKFSSTIPKTYLKKNNNLFNQFTPFSLSFRYIKYVNYIICSILCCLFYSCIFLLYNLFSIEFVDNTSLMHLFNSRDTFWTYLSSNYDIFNSFKLFKIYIYILLFLMLISLLYYLYRNIILILKINNTDLNNIDYILMFIDYFLCWCLFFTIIFLYWKYYLLL